MRHLWALVLLGSYSVLADFRDDFDGASVDPNHWDIYQPFSQSHVEVSGGWVSLVSRGGLIAQETYPGQVQISGRFRNLSSQDAFKVVLRSNLSTFETFGEKTGVVVVFYQNAVVIADSGISGVFAQKTGLDLSGETLFQITDDGSRIAVLLNGSAIPLLDSATTRRTGDKVIFYNREIAGTRLDLDFLAITTGPELQIAPAVQITFNTEAGKSYQIQTSTDLQNWTAVESPISGTGAKVEKFLVAKNGTASFYRAEIISDGSGGVTTPPD
jgi:hypothetical protein